MRNKFRLTIIILSIVIAGGILVFDFNTEEENGLNNDQEVTQDEYKYQDILEKTENPEDLITYLNNDFELVDDEDQNLEEFLSSQKGSKEDFLYFLADILYDAGLHGGVITYRSEDESVNSVTMFRGEDLPSYIYFDSDNLVKDNHGWSFEDLFNKEEERLGVEIRDYKIFDPATMESMPDDWINR